MEFVFISLFGYVSVFCFFLKALLVKANYEKEQKIVPFFFDKTKSLGCERYSILATPETKAVFRQ